MIRLPLAWLQLKKEKLRFAVALSGVGFAVVLMMMQLGFLDSMYSSGVRYHRLLRYDLVLHPSESPYIVYPQRFARVRLYEARGAAGVASVTPVYFEQSLFENPFTGGVRNIFVIAFEPDDDPLDVPAIRAQLDVIKLRDVYLFDEASRPEFGPIAEHFREHGPIATEINRRTVTIGGLFQLGTSFGLDGSLVTSTANFLRLFPGRSAAHVTLGLIELAEGADAKAVQRDLVARLPNDVRVMTRPEFIAMEHAYWGATTPIGYVFGFGVVIAILVGCIIVNQILFADVSDHIAEYATLKAIGYSNATIAGVVLQQAVILAVLGYLPGLAISLWLYGTAGEATRLPIEMTMLRAVSVLALTVGMCALSALVAIRRVRSADPAEIF